MDLNKLFKNPDDIQKLISLLQTMVDTTSSSDEDEDDDNEEIDQPIRTRSRKVSQPSSKKSKKDQNKFLSMQEMNMHKEDNDFQRKVSKQAPVPRNRGFEPIRVKCRVCGKTESVNPSIVDSIERYKCNNCASSAG